MTLFYKPTSEYVEVYDISYDSSGYPLFLIYQDGQWIRRSAKEFKPHHDWDKEGVKGSTYG